MFSNATLTRNLTGGRNLALCSLVTIAVQAGLWIHKLCRVLCAHLWEKATATFHLFTEIMNSPNDPIFSTRNRH